MKITFEISEPENVWATLSINMPISKWRQLHEDLGTVAGSPWWEIRSGINDVIRQAQETFRPKPPK